MGWAQAVAMSEVGKRFDNAALLHLATNAVVGHPLQFRSQGRKAMHPGIYLGDVSHSDGMGR